MKLLRLRIAITLLCGAGIVAGPIAGPDLHGDRKPDQDANLHVASPAGYILLASLTGLAICFVWIAMTWRAWS
jgi:hypothetical protein